MDAQLNFFLNAIRANPEDDLPRLAFANWLEEQINSMLGSEGEPDPLTVGMTHPKIDRVVWKESENEVFVAFDDDKGIGGSFYIHDQRIELLYEKPESSLRRIRRLMKEWTGW